MGTVEAPRNRTVRTLRLTELALVFGALPPVLGFLCPPATWIFALWALALAAAWVLHRRREPGEPAAATPPLAGLWRIVVRFAVLAAVLVASVWWAQPEALFSLPRQRPALWLLILLLYPLLSVWPQELLFRRWFFQRYGAMLGFNVGLLVVNSLAFGWAHVVLRNPVAILLTVGGGWLFADTYRRSGSLALVCLEHALYGGLVFTVGLGPFFYHGAVR